MRVVELDEKRRLVVAERLIASPIANQVRIDISFCGICGSDLHMRGQPNVIGAGGVLGHEFSGRISEIGSDVRDWTVGDPVVVMPYDYCGKCRYCVSGNENQCLVTGVLGTNIHGVHLQGGFAESLITDSHRLHRIPPGVDEKHAALVEPLAVASRAAARAACDDFSCVLVIGGGPIGLFVALVLRAQGRDRLALMDRNPARAEIAAQLGLKSLSGETTAEQVGDSLGGEAPSVVVDCSGSPAATKFATEIVRPQGRVVLVGQALQPIQLDPDTLIIREIELVGSAGAGKRDVEMALGLITSGDLPFDDMITGVVSLADTEDAFDALSDPRTTHVKVLVQP
jgi:(R,R)-butanediol dehydrogenase/meso-butanediol dehydrogenase/diacetyl reductase